ncbi:MAG: RDD family protein [Methyloligella sp. ZOD6]
MPFCPSCGGYVGSGDRFCAACGTELSPARTAKEARPGPGASVPPAGTRTPNPSGSGEPMLTPDEAQYLYANLMYRALAQIVDLLLIGAFWWYLGLEIADRFGGRTPGGFALQGMPALLLMSGSLLAAFFYYALLEGFWSGQTIGKRLLGIKVVRLDGGPCDFAQAMMRTLLRLVDGLFFYFVGAVFVITSPRHQRLGDRVAGTTVVFAR